MKKTVPLYLLLVIIFQSACAPKNISKHPDTGGSEWKPLFKNDLSDAIFEKGVWTIADGVITASKDEALWSEKTYNDFMLDLEFQNAVSTNSGVIVHASDLKNWIPNSVEIQIADDYSTKWSTADPTWQCAAIFGHQAASKRAVKKPGEWNHYTITCQGRRILVVSMASW